MALNSIKKTFTSCYIPRRNSSVELAQDSMINETDENEIAKNTHSENGIKLSCSAPKVLHNIPSSMIKVTKEDKANLEYVLVMNNLQDYNMI